MDQIKRWLRDDLPYLRQDEATLKRQIEASDSVPKTLALLRSLAEVQRQIEYTVNLLGEEDAGTSSTDP